MTGCRAAPVGMWGRGLRVGAGQVVPDPFAVGVRLATLRRDVLDDGRLGAVLPCEHRGGRATAVRVGREPGRVRLVDRATTRERRTLRARYRLVELSTGAVVLDATAGSDAGIDVVSSQYATIAAEQSALERLSEVVADQMVGRLALFVSRTPAIR